MSRALRLTTRAQLGSSLMSSSRLAAAAISSWVGRGGLPAPPLLIPQNQSRHWRNRPGAGEGGSGRNCGRTVSWLPQLPHPSSPGSALPSISTACSGRPFCTGAEGGPASSSASRSSRSSLLYRRLKTRRWSWGRVGAGTKWECRSPTPNLEVSHPHRHSLTSLCPACTPAQAHSRMTFHGCPLPSG